MSFGFRITSREPPQNKDSNWVPVDMPEEKRKKIATQRKRIEAIKRSLVNLPEQVELDDSFTDPTRNAWDHQSHESGFLASVLQRIRNFFLKPVILVIGKVNVDEEFIIIHKHEAEVPTDVEQTPNTHDNSTDKDSQPILLSEASKESSAPPGFKFKFHAPEDITAQNPRPRNTN